MNKTLFFYIFKKLILTFFLVVTSIVLLIGVMNIFDILNQVSDKNVNFIQIILLDILQIPNFVEQISVFLIMLSSMITLFSLSIRSEISVMRVSGLSLLQILTPIASGAFLLGLFMVLIFNPISIASSKKFIDMEKLLINNEEINYLEPANGIWMKQQNFSNEEEEVIIRVASVDRHNLYMKDINLWFFDKDYKFYKKIDAKNMFLKDGQWQLSDVIINDKNHVNSKKPSLKISTNLQAEFITKKILNNFEDANLFTIYDLPKLIDNLSDSGFSPRKFVVRYYSLLSTPLLFVAMSLLAAFFAINNARSNNNVMIFILGILVGLILYVCFIIINAFGSSGLIPTFLSTWMLAIIMLSISMLLIFKKEVNN